MSGDGCSSLAAQIIDGKRHPQHMGAPEVTAFLNHLAVERHSALRPRTRRWRPWLFLSREVIAATSGGSRGSCAPGAPSASRGSERGRDGLPHRRAARSALADGNAPLRRRSASRRVSAVAGQGHRLWPWGDPRTRGHTHVLNRGGRSVHSRAGRLTMSTGRRQAARRAAQRGASPTGHDAYALGQAKQPNVHFASNELAQPAPARGNRRFD